MIWYHQPFDLNKNIGVYYNQAMSMIDDSDWCCFVDGDAMFTTASYGQQIETILQANPSYGLLYATTNRIGCEWQKADGIDTKNDDIKYHRKVGESIWMKFGSKVEKVNCYKTGGSGFLILVNKQTWKMAGTFSQYGMLGVDWNFFERVKRARVDNIGLMKGIYLYHWYRGGDSANTKHLS